MLLWIRDRGKGGWSVASSELTPPKKTFYSHYSAIFEKTLKRKDITSLIKSNSISLLLQVIIFLEPIFILLG